MGKGGDIKKYIADEYRAKRDGNVVAYQIPDSDIIRVCKELYFKHKLPLKTITATDNRSESGEFLIYYIFGVPIENIFLAPYITLKNKEDFPSITKYIHAASGYERKIKSFFGLTPLGHPHSSQISLHENWPEQTFPLRKDFNWQTRPKEARGEYKFQKIAGEGIYEIPVGPVHAGIIEPGHFRFSVAGEEVVFLEPRLGYTHKGAEKLFEILPLEKKVRLAEKVSGDTSFTHALAFCQAIENLADIEVSERALYLRVIFSELERLANHFNDFGFIMMDAGYNFGGARGARLRELIMQWNERLSGNRFLRGVNLVGGVTLNITDEFRTELLDALKNIEQEFKKVVTIAKNSGSLLNRFLGTGKLDYQTALDHAVVGVAGRALGVARDARKDYPYAAYDKIKFAIALASDGDVYARWLVRVKEIYSSLSIIEQALCELPANRQLKYEQEPALRRNSFAIGVAEGWRGEIVYFVVTDSSGQVSRVDIRDPSFVNWTLVGYAAQGNAVADFPLINKSFNLSYSGNDL